MREIFDPRRRFVLGALSGVLLPLGQARAQTSIPEGPVRIIVPYTPGTAGDTGARALAPRLSERIGRPVIVDNRPGASGTIGTEAVVRAAPNGSTLMISPNTLVTSASLYPALPYNPVRDLTPISLTHSTGLIIVAHPSTGFKNARDLIAAARSRPGKINYASPGVGTPNHLVMEMFKVSAKVFLTHIPYRGTGPQVTDILGGQVETGALSVLAAAPHIKSGKLIGIGIASEKRHPLLPELPTLAEVGVPNVNGDIWFGLFGPAGMAPDLVARLNKEVREIVQSAPFRSGMERQGLQIEVSTADEFKRLVQSDAERYAALIRSQGIKAE
ncbi:MAG: tripartite tricarboxylate transporter substrate binding protein [Burkholderiaceae bacterium]|nr:tripartite tricarboxylate transporter substrate binding protein [Burkholderiaceae bacterium]